MRENVTFCPSRIFNSPPGPPGNSTIPSEECHNRAIHTNINPRQRTTSRSEIVCVGRNRRSCVSTRKSLRINGEGTPPGNIVYHILFTCIQWTRGSVKRWGTSSLKDITSIGMWSQFCKNMYGRSVSYTRSTSLCSISQCR